MAAEVRPIRSQGPGRCSGTNKRGEPCKRNPIPSKPWCAVHDPDESARRAKQKEESQGPGASYLDRGQLVTPALGRDIEAAGHLRVGEDGRLWRYLDGVYQPDGEEFATQQVRELLGDYCRRSHFGEVTTWCKARPATIQGWPPSEFINVANGLLDWRTLELHPHTPDVVSIVQLPVEWNPSADCPEWSKYISRVTPERSRELESPTVAELIEELLGYTLLPGNWLRKAVLLIGPTGTGKSKLLQVWRALLGRRNCSAQTLQAISGENRFAAASLYGKLANICGDLDARTVERSDYFKMIVGGDEVPIERKYGHPFEPILPCKLIFSANEAPLSRDQTDAWFERWVPVPFERQIPESEQDPRLGELLTMPAELSGVLLLAVMGLRRLEERGRFELPAEVRAAKGTYRERLDSVRGFVGERCSLAEGQWVPRMQLYRAYAEWCTEGGRKPLSRESFYDRVRNDWPAVVEQKPHSGIREFRGIGLLATF